MHTNHSTKFVTLFIAVVTIMLTTACDEDSDSQGPSAIKAVKYEYKCPEWHYYSDSRADDGATAHRINTATGEIQALPDMPDLIADPNGDYIIFIKHDYEYIGKKVPRFTLWKAAPDGSAQEQLLPTVFGEIFAPVLSPDGTKLALHDRSEDDDTDGMDLWVVDLITEQVTNVYNYSAFFTYNTSFSPDSRYLAIAAGGGWELSEICIYDTQTDELKKTTPSSPFTSDGRIIWSANSDYAIVNCDWDLQIVYVDGHSELLPFIAEIAKSSYYLDYNTLLYYSYEEIVPGNDYMTIWQLDMTTGQKQPVSPIDKADWILYTPLPYYAQDTIFAIRHLYEGWGDLVKLCISTGEYQVFAKEFERVLY